VEVNLICPWDDGDIASFLLDRFPVESFKETVFADPAGDVPLFRFRLEELADQVSQVVAELRRRLALEEFLLDLPEFLRCLRPLHSIQHALLLLLVLGALWSEWMAARGEQEGDDAQAVVVDCLVVVQALQQLGCDVKQCADGSLLGIRNLALGRLANDGNIQVDYSNEALVVQQDVFGLQIAMHHLKLAVHLLERVGEHPKVHPDRCFIHEGDLLPVKLELTSCTIFEHHVKIRAVLRGRKRLADVGAAFEMREYFSLHSCCLNGRRAHIDDIGFIHLFDDTMSTRIHMLHGVDLSEGPFAEYSHSLIFFTRNCR